MYRRLSEACSSNVDLAPSDESSFVELLHDAEELVEVGVDENGFGAFGGNGGEGGIVDTAGVDGAVFGEVVDDEVDEGDLVVGVALAVEELGKGSAVSTGGCS